jgi:hypothetical protein
VKDRILAVALVAMGLVALGIQRGWPLSVAGAVVLVLGLAFLVLGAP